jgi:hypothetical protein
MYQQHPLLKNGGFESYYVHGNDAKMDSILEKV